MTRQGWTRRRFLAAGVGGSIGAAFAGLALVEHGVLPGNLREQIRFNGPTVALPGASPA